MFSKISFVAFGLSAAILPLQVNSAASCFRADGSEDIYPNPCPAILKTPMCCYVNRSNTSIPDDVCTPQGLCVSSSSNSSYFVVGCISPNWAGDSGCSPLYAACGLQHPNDYLQVTPCRDGSYCCNADNSTCCASGIGIYLSANGREIISRPVIQGSKAAVRGLTIAVGVVSVLATLLAGCLLWCSLRSQKSLSIAKRGQANDEASDKIVVDSRQGDIALPELTQQSHRREDELDSREILELSN